MAFSRTAISKAENQARGQYGIECRYNQATSQWYKVVGGVVTPFNLAVSTERTVRDYCRNSLLQAQYDEDRAAEAQRTAADAAPPPSGGSMWGQLLDDRNVRGAVANALPSFARPFVAPALDALGSAINSAGSLKDALSQSPVKAAREATAAATAAAADRDALGDPATMASVGAARTAATVAARKAAAEKAAQQRLDRAKAKADAEIAADPFSVAAMDAADNQVRQQQRLDRAKQRAEDAKNARDVAQTAPGVADYEAADGKAKSTADEANAANRTARVAGLTSLAGGFMAGRSVGQTGVGGGLGSWLGMRAGGAGASALGGAAGMAVEGVLTESFGSGKKAVEHFARGALSVAGAALNAGSQLANQVVSGVLKPFGASGSAVASLSNTVTSTLTGAITGGLKVASQGAAILGGVGAAAVGGGAMLGGAALGGIIGTLVPIFTPLIGAGVGAAIGGILAVGAIKLVEVASSVIGTVFDTLGTALGELGKVGGAALNTLISVLDDVRNEAMSLSKSILDMSQQSGMGVGASAIAVNNLAGFGISPQQAAGMFGQNVLFQQAKDRAWGIQGDAGSADNLRDTHRVYQQLLAQGGGNPLIANLMMQQTGKQALIPMANLPTDKFERSLSNGSGLQMSGKAVEEWQQNFGLMMNDLNRFVQFVKVTLGTAFLPALQKGLGMAVEYFHANKEEIVDGIRLIGRWFYAELPNFVVGGAAMVVRGFGTIMRGMGEMVKGFSDGQGPLYKFIEGFLGGIDKMVGALRHVLAVAVGVGAGIAVAMTGVGAPLAVGAGVLAYGATMLATRGLQTDLAGSFKKSTARQFDANGNPVPTVFDQAHTSLMAGADRADKLGDTLDKYRKDNLNPDKLGKQYDGMFSTLQKIEENTGKKQTVNANVSVSISPQEDFFAKVQSYETWNTWAALGQNGA